jgi:hypothetical protein
VKEILDVMTIMVAQVEIKLNGLQTEKDSLSPTNKLNSLLKLRNVSQTWKLSWATKLG